MSTNETSRVVYPPLDVPKPVGEDAWIVDGGPLHALGVPIPVRMTVVRLGDGGLWLHSPTPYSDAAREAVEALGPIRHLVAPNIAHWMHLKDWHGRRPDARTWAAPGLRRRVQVRASGLRLDEDLGPEAPPAWADEMDQAVLHGGLGLSEVVFFHRRSRTLIVTDLIENLEEGKLPLPLRMLARAGGATAPDGMAPPHYRFAVNRRRAEAQAVARRLLDWAPERVVLSHGQWFERDGTERLRRSLRWLLD